MITIRRSIDQTIDAKDHRGRQNLCFSEVHRSANDDVSSREGPPVRNWPQPRELRLELPPAAPFDANALLPAALAEFVLDEADRMPCAPDYIAASLLGATMAQMTELTGWLPHSVRATLSRTLRQQRGLEVTCASSERGERRYRITGKTAP
jgi:hypothetical protein